MAVTIGNVTVQEIRNVTSTPVSGTFSHDNNGDGLAIVMLALDASTPSADADYTATYDSVSVPTQVETEAGLTDDIPRGEILFLESAASGSNTVAWEFDHPDGGQIDSYLIVAISISGNGAIGGVAATTGTDSSLSVNITADEIGSLLLGAAAIQGFDGVPYTAGSGYTLLSGATDLQSDTVSTNSDISGSVQSKTTTATGSQAFDMSWSVSDGACIIAIEILQADAGATVNVGQAVETDSALAVTGVQSTATVDVGQAVETDSALAVTGVQSTATVDVGQASETDSAQAVTPAQGAATVAVGLATETDSALAATVVKTATNVPVGQAIEGDTAQPIDISGNILVGQALEQDSAGGIAPVGQIKIQVHEPWTLVSSLITESPSFEITGGWDRPLLIARTSSAGGTLRTVTVLQYGGQEMTLVEEEITTGGRDLQTAVWILDEDGINAAIDDTFTVTTDNSEATQFRLQAAVYAHVNQVGPVLDSFSVNATGGATPTPEALTTGENGLAVIAAGANFGTSDDPDVDVTYSNLTQQIESAGTQSYAGIAHAETDGTDFTASTTYVDTNLGHMIGLSLAVGIKTLAIGQAESTETGQAVNLQRRVLAGQGAEVDTALAVTADTATEVAVGQAVETDTGQAIEPVLPGRIEVGQAIEADSAQAVTARFSNTVAVGLASETDTGQALGQTTKVASVFQATETDTALTIVGQEPPDLDLIRRQKEAGSFGRDRLEQQTEIEHQRQLRAKLIRERDDEDLLSIIPAITRYLLRH